MKYYGFVKSSGPDKTKTGFFLDEGDVVTARGVTSAIDLGLHLVERFVGKEGRERIRRQMDYFGWHCSDKSARKCKRGGINLTHHNGTSGTLCQALKKVLRAPDPAAIRK